MLKLIQIYTYMVEDVIIVINDTENVVEDVEVFFNSYEQIECPICIDYRLDMIRFPCGHSICSECITLMILHNQMNNCPMCRCHLSWNEIMQYYDITDVNDETGIDDTPMRDNNDNNDNNGNNVLIINLTLYFVGIIIFVIFCLSN
jgi:hypothetical protein